MTGKWTILGALILGMMILVTGCWNSRELNSMAIVMGMGIDKIPKKNEYVVTFQVVNPGSVTAGTTGGGKATSVSVFTGSDPTLFGALRKTSQNVPRQLFFAHIQVLVIGESLAKEGIDELFDFYERSHELRLNTLVLVSRGTDAASVLKVLTPLEKTPARAIAGRIEYASKIWAENLEINVDDIIKALTSQGEPVISGIHITGDQKKIGESLSNIEQTDMPRKINLKGIALFKDGKLKHWMDGKEARGAVWLKNKMKGSIININCKEKKESTSIELVLSKTKVKVKIKKGMPVFQVHIREEGNVNEVHCPIDLSKRVEIKKLEEELEKETEKEIKQAFTAAQKNKSDIFGFGNEVSRQYPKVWEKLEKNWGAAFAESKIEIQVDAYIRRTGMRMKPYLSETKEKG